MRRRPQTAPSPLRRFCPLSLLSLSLSNFPPSLPRPFFGVSGRVADLGLALFLFLSYIAPPTLCPVLTTPPRPLPPMAWLRRRRQSATPTSCHTSVFPPPGNLQPFAARHFLMVHTIFPLLGPPFFVYPNPQNRPPPPPFPSFVAARTATLRRAGWDEEESQRAMLLLMSSPTLYRTIHLTCVNLLPCLLLRWVANEEGAVRKGWWPSSCCRRLLRRPAPPTRRFVSCAAAVCVLRRLSLIHSTRIRRKPAYSMCIQSLCSLTITLG